MGTPELVLSHPATELMGEAWTHTHNDLIVLTQNYGILS
jgi:hypothetical protein